MKKNKLRISGLLLIVCCAFALASCDLEGGHCKHTDSPYWCSSAKVCCAYKYHDGHGTCWETMSGCRSSGYACTTCHIEDDDD